MQELIAKVYPTMTTEDLRLCKSWDARSDEYTNARRAHTEVFTLLHMHSLSQGRAELDPFGEDGPSTGATNSHQEVPEGTFPEGRFPG